MPRRIEIELTSQRDDGTWTWRAAGARRPKGEVSGDLVPDAAAVGSVLKAEVDGGLDGLEITALFAPRARSESSGRLELIGGGAGPLVTTALVSGSRRHSHTDRDSRRDGAAPSRERRRGRDQQDGRGRGTGDRRGGRDQQDGRGRGTGDRRGGRDQQDGRGRGTGDRRGGRDQQDGRGRDQGDRRGGRDQQDGRGRGTGRSDRDSEDGRRDGADRKPRRTDRAGRGPRDGRDSGPDRTEARGTGREGRRSGDRRPDGQTRSKSDKRSARPPRPRTAGLKAKRVHRQAALTALPEEQRHLAREVLRGGVPGVRRSIERMNAKAAGESLPPIKSDPVLALAEQLAPVLKAAEWHDRADAALVGIAKIDLRDIRSVIAAADRAARDDETRALAESLRAGLAQRLEVDHRKWLDELANTISEGRTVRALRISSRPPKPGSPLPPDMAERLAALAAADLNPTANQQRWATVVDSIALSPVRTQVIPAGIPTKPGDELVAAIRRLANRVPQIAALFGIQPESPRHGGLRPPPPPPAPSGSEDAQ